MVIRPQKWNFNPRQHQSGCLFAKQCQINGYDAIVTVEDFAEHELKTIDAVTAKKQAYCNLFQTLSGQIGIFDFNRCGDNNLFCDAFMQAVFEARLMEYPDGAGDKIRPEILSAFLRGYRSIFLIRLRISSMSRNHRLPNITTAAGNNRNAPISP